MYNGGKRRKNWSSGNSSWKKSSLAQDDNNMIGFRDQTAAGGRVTEDRKLNSRSTERGRTRKCSRENHGKDFAVMNPRRFNSDDESATGQPKNDSSSLDAQKEQIVDRITMQRMYFYFGMSMFLESNTQVSLQSEAGRQSEMNPECLSSSGSIPTAPGQPQRSLRLPSQSVGQSSSRSPSHLSRSWRGHMARSGRSLDYRPHQRRYSNYVGNVPGEGSNVPRAKVERGAEMMKSHLRDGCRSEDPRTRTERSCGNTASAKSFNCSTSTESGIPESCDLNSPPPWPELRHQVQPPVVQDPAAVSPNVFHQGLQHLQSSGLVSYPPWRPPILSSSSPIGGSSALLDRPPSGCAWYWYHVLPPTNSCDPSSGNYPGPYERREESSSLQEVKSSNSLQMDMAALSLDRHQVPDLHGNKVDVEVGKPNDAAPVQHDAAPVQHDAAPVQHGAAPVQHGASPVQHGPAPVQHGAAPVQHGASPVQHGAAPVQHGASPVQHGAAPVQHGAAPVQHGVLSEQYDIMPVQPGRTNEQVLTEFNMYRDWDYIPPLTGAVSVSHHAVPRHAVPHHAVPRHAVPRDSIPRAENGTNDVISDNESEDSVIVTIRSGVL